MEKKSMADACDVCGDKELPYRKPYYDWAKESSYPVFGDWMPKSNKKKVHAHKQPQVKESLSFYGMTQLMEGMLDDVHGGIMDDIKDAVRQIKLSGRSNPRVDALVKSVLNHGGDLKERYQQLNAIGQSLRGNREVDLEALMRKHRIAPAPPPPPTRRK
jgi:hypothetical protein